jgi:hypothetical protein
MVYALGAMSMSNSQQQRIVTSCQYDRVKKLLSTTCRGENHPTYGTKMPEAEKEKIRVRMLGDGNHRKGVKPWNYGLTLETSEELRDQFERHRKRVEKNPELRGGPKLGHKFSATMRANLSAAKRGVPKTPEHREKLRQANLGKKLSPERIEKTASKLRGKVFPEDWKAARRAKMGDRAKRVFTRESRLKMSQPVYQIDPVTLEPTVAWLSMSIAAEQVGAKTGLRISAAARRKCKASGYYWVYAKKPPQERTCQKKSSK